MKFFLVIMVFVIGCYETEAENLEKITSDIGVTNCMVDKDCPDYQRQDCFDNVCEDVEVVAFVHLIDGDEILELSMKGDISFENGLKKYHLRTVKNTSKMTVTWDGEGPHIDLDVAEFIYTGSLTERYTQVVGEWKQLGPGASRASMLLEDRDIKDGVNVDVNFIEVM